MTVSSTTNRNDYVGNSAVGTYSYTFRILDQTHLRVTVRDTSSPPVETTLTLTTHYTVTGVGDAGGGSVLLVNGAFSWLDASGKLKSGYSLTIRRVLPIKQETDLRNQGSFYAETHEDQFDRAAMVAQQQQDEIGRSLKLPETEAGSSAATVLPTAANRASKFLAFDASGNPIASSGNGTPATAFWSAILDDATLVASLASMGLSANVQTMLLAADYAAIRSALSLAALALKASIATGDIDADAVTYAKMQNVSAASKLLGRGSASAGDPEEITLGTGLSMAGATLNAIVGMTDPMTTRGDIIVRDSTNTTARKAVGTGVLKANGTDVTGWGTVAESDLGASVVSQGKLKTATATYSTATSVYTVVTLSGGGYGFLPTIGADNTNATKKLCTHRNGQDVDNTDIGTSASIIAQTAQYTFGVSASGVSTLILQERYVAACPPYNLGDGDVPLFIFALMRSDGSIHSLVVTADPPWANNGPTSIRPDLVSPAGKEFKLVKQVIAEHGSYEAAKQALGVQTVAQRLATDLMVPIEITQTIKQADMPIIPHSFISHPIKAGETVVLVQPVGALCESLLRLHEHGESLAGLFHQGHLLIGNTALALKAPPGVMPVAAKWKITA